MHHLAKVACPYGHRGFESPPLRQFFLGKAALPVAHRSTQQRRRANVLLALICPILAVACQGPPLTLSTDGPRYVDGRTDSRTEIPFRYYGTMVVDVLPADLENGAPNWNRTPVRGLVAMPAPVSRWIFPFDLPIELMQRSFGLVEPFRATIETETSEEPVVAGYLPGGIPALRQRANAARSER